MILSNIALLLDLSEMDNILLNYIKRLNEKYHFKSVHLIHFMEVEEMPPEILNLFPDMDQSVDEMIAQEMREQIDECMPDCGEVADVYVHKGGKMEAFLEWMDNQNFDLVVLGKKAAIHGSGIFPSKMVRLLDVNTLFVSEMARGDIHKIMVPIDFSEYTNNALKVAKEASDLLSTELIPVHGIKVNMLYYPYVKNKEELQDHFIKAAKKKYEKLKEKLKIKSDCQYFVLAEDGHISKTIYDQATFQSADLIVVGNKGKADSSDLLIGSVAERLISHDKNIPVLIVKKGG